MARGIPRSLVLGLAWLLLLPPAAEAQAAAAQSRPIPLLPDGVDAATSLPALRTDHAALPGLMALDRVVLTGLPMPGEASVDLELERIDLGRLDFGFQVNGLPAPGLLDGLSLSVWRGSVAGQPGSEALLSFSHKGSRGWVRAGGDVLHLLPQPGDGGDWLEHRVLLAHESELLARGMRRSACATPAPAAPLAPPPSAGAQAPAGPADGLPNCEAWNCPMAIETDFQLFQVFGDLGAETAYLTSLLAAVSDRYEEQVDTQLTFPYVQFYTTAADPWSSPDGFGDTWSMLFEFQDAWSGSVPAGARLAHFVSGAFLGGGLAYVGVLNDVSNSHTFAVSADLHGQNPFPIAVSPLNWDFMVFAHETGHNFGAPHTHDMDPPVDECAFGLCTDQGTIMSYCHLCEGGLENITTYFAPESAAIMIDLASLSLPKLAPLIAEPETQPSVVTEDGPTPLTVELPGIAIGDVTLNYRYAPAAPWKFKVMSPLGGDAWGATLPAPLCGEEPEWFFQSIDPDCGFYLTPTFAAEVGDKSVLAHHDFEMGAGWTGVVAGDTATGGSWTRGDPVGTYSEPHADFSPAGTQCWYTGAGVPGGAQEAADVDGGKTTLLSPIIDLSGGDARIGYWRWFACDDVVSGEDSLRVDVSNDNGLFWTTVETLVPQSGGWFSFWVHHEFTVSDFVSPTGLVRIRFVATDAGSDSIVEAAVDEFEVYRIECETTCQPGLGFSWPPAPAGASLSVCGGDLSSGTHAVLLLEHATPGSIATFFVSLAFNPTPFKGGLLVPLPQMLLTPVPVNGAGKFSANVPGGGGPLSIYLQAVYPAPGTAPANVELSNAVRIDLQP